MKTRLRGSTSLLLPSSLRQSDHNCPSSSRLSRSPLCVPACLLLRWSVAGLLWRVVPWGLVKHLHELAGSDGKSTAKSKVTRLKHGDILRTIFSRCNGAREYSKNISTAKFLRLRYGTRSKKVNVVRACYGYGYGCATATGTGVLRLRVRACYGYGYGRATATDTGVLRIRAYCCYGYGLAKTVRTGVYSRA